MPATDPAPSAFFDVEFGSQLKGNVKEVSGISSEVDVVTQYSTSGKQTLAVVPGAVKWGDITLKRAMTDDLQFWIWRKKVEAGDMSAARANGTITLYDTAGTPQAKWNVINAWPKQLTGPTPSAGANQQAMEELVLVIEGFTREQ